MSLASSSIPLLLIILVYLFMNFLSIFILVSLTFDRFLILFAVIFAHLIVNLTSM